MSKKSFPIKELIAALDNVSTNKEAATPARELVSRYLAKDSSTELRATIRRANTDPMLGDQRRSRLSQAIREAFPEEPDSKSRDFKRLLLRISILDAAPDPWETYKKLVDAILPARRAGVDVDWLRKEFAAISSKGVAHLMRDYKLQIDLLEWYKEPDYSVEIRHLTETMTKHRTQKTVAPLATNDEVKLLKRMLMSSVNEVADQAAFLLIQVYTHPNTPEIQRDFIRQIGYFEDDYSMVSRLESAGKRLVADEPDAEKRSLKQALLAMSIRNGKLDPRDDFLEMADLEAKAKSGGAEFVAIIEEIASISAPCMSKVMLEGSRNLMTFDTYNRKEVKL